MLCYRTLYARPRSRRLRIELCVRALARRWLHRTPSAYVSCPGYLLSEISVPCVLQMSLSALTLPKSEVAIEDDHSPLLLLSVECAELGVVRYLSFETMP